MKGTGKTFLIHFLIVEKTGRKQLPDFRQKRRYFVPPDFQKPRHLHVRECA